MAERSPAFGAGLVALALLLAAGCWFDPRAAAPLAWLAQVPAAIGIALLRRTRDRRDALPDAGRLALLWAAAFLVAGVLLAWPLASLLSAPSLPTALTLSALGGALLVALWRYWPDWQTLERHGGSRAARRLLAPSPERDAWAGLQVAVPALLLLTGALLLSWPGLLTGSARMVGCALYALFLPLTHFALQSARTALRPRGLPVVEMAPVDAREAADVVPDVAQEGDAAPVVGGADDRRARLTHDLYVAARRGRVDAALALLEAGADPSGKPEPDAHDRRSLAVLAAVLPDLRLLRALIERGIDVNAMDAGLNPLLAATRDSWHGRPEAVMTLLANGADVHATDAEGNTPLHHAARSSDPGVAALLRDAGADLNAVNGAGVSPLGSACASGNWRLARFLLERGARPEPEGGQPALLSAAGGEDDDAAGVQLLLRHKARIGATGPRGRSALHEAAAAGHAGIVHALLDAGADPRAVDPEGRTPLHEAARAGALPVVEALLDAGAAADARDREGGSVLHHACQAELPSREVVERLLARGVDPAAVDGQGRSAADLAAAAGRWSLATLLDPARAPDAGDTVSSDAQLPEPRPEPEPERPPALLLREALLEGADAAELERRSARLAPGELDRLLADAELTASLPVLGWLLRRGANPELRAPGQEPLTLSALQRGEAGIDTLILLFGHGASPAGRGNLARFLGACRTGGAGPRGEAMALELVERGADPFAAAATGEPPLLLAVELGWLTLASRLLALGVNPDRADTRGHGALHVAARRGNLAAVRALVAAGASPDLRAGDGQTPLGIALAHGRRDLTEWLDWRHWLLPRRPLAGADLPAAAVAGDQDAVRRLLDLGLPIDATDAQGCTALLRAAGGGHAALVELLLARGADPCIAARTGATPLSAAVSTRHLDIVERLLAAGSNLEQRLPGDVTVLMLAAALGLPEVVSRLLRAGADLKACDGQGLNALHCAALYGFTARDRTRLLALLDGLLLAGADANAAARDGATPLLLLLGARAEPGTPSSEDVLLAAMERLLDEDVALDVRDPRGLSPLHLAGLHGLPRVVRVLLRAGADPDQRDLLNRTPRDLALLRGYVDVAAELNPGDKLPSSTVPMARFLRD